MTPEQQREWRARNPEHQREYHKKWRAQNRLKCIESVRRWRAKNPGKELEKAKQWRLKNSERIKIYRAKMGETFKKKFNQRRRERNCLDPQYTLSCRLRARIHSVLKRRNTSKVFSTLDLVGTTIAKLALHIESQFHEGMTWENRGYNGWHIDHIIPCSSFDLTDPEQQKKCFNYTNLQPLWWWENLAKGDK